jgi:aspartyl-tRNA(Asn)/glutamyl-tRNA(Gln) amidotransferase subunit A
VTVAQVVDDIRARRLSPREAVERTLERIERLDPRLNAYVSVRADASLREAERPPAGPLHGAPVAVKDVIDVAGEVTTAGSRLLLDNRATRDASVVARLRAAGAIVIGKLNTHEFAYGPTTTSSHIGPTRNPWSIDRITGGSSGGSAAAAAALLAAGTLGTDTAGSIRMPASLCGVTGLRPSPGLVPLDGIVPVAPTFDTVGPIARTAEDCALLLSVLADRPYPLQDRVDGLRVGVVEALVDLADPDVAERVEEAIVVLRALGTSIGVAEVPLATSTSSIQQAIMLPEAASQHLELLRTNIADYSTDVRRRLLSGLLLPAAAYVTALRLRSAYRESLARVFERFDVLVAPTMPCTAPCIEDGRDEPTGGHGTFRSAILPFNAPWTVAGLPTLSVPCGLVDGLPVGLALVGRADDEKTVLELGQAFQRTTDWHERLPPIS